MTAAVDDAMPASRWRRLWTFLRRLEAAAALTGDEARDRRLDRHDARLLALEGRLGLIDQRRGEAPAAGPSPRHGTS